MLSGKPTCMRTFDEIPHFIFLGIVQMIMPQTGSFGSQPLTSHSIQIVKGNMGDIVQQNAHKDQITDIECTVFNNQQIFFTTSLDSTVKAWTVSPDQKSLVLAAEMPLSGKGLTMQIVDTLVLIGLDNGTIAGWNLTTNVIDNLPAHNQGISHLQRYHTLLFSGSKSGQV